MRAAEEELVAALRITAPLDAATLAAYLHRSRHADLAALARREGVAGLLYRDIRHNGLDDCLDARVLDRLRDLYVGTAAANARRMAAVRELVAHPDLKGVKVVVLKGMALLDDIYRDWGLRPMTDIDLWVDEESCSRLHGAFRGLGYVSQPYYPDTFRRDGVSMDVHTSLLGSERIGARRRILAGGDSGAFERARRFGVGGCTAWRLDSQDTVLFACLHLLKHNACRLLWLLEVDALVASWNADDRAVLARRAEGAGQRRAIELVAFLARDLLVDPAQDGGNRQGASCDEGSLPESDDDSGAPSRPGGDAGETRAAGLPALAHEARLSWMTRRALSRRRTKGSLPVWGPLAFFNSGGGAGARAAAAFETLFPRPATLRQIFRDESSPLPFLYFRRFWRLVEMIVRR